MAERLTTWYPGGPAPDWRGASDRLFAALDGMTDVLRLHLAILRDNRLTNQELLAALEVYQEFGR